jgi:amino acid permease
MAARRALDLVAGGDDALLAAALTGSVSWQLLVSGRFAEAEHVAVRAAESIEPHGEVPTAALSVYGRCLSKWPMPPLGMAAAPSPARHW